MFLGDLSLDPVNFISKTIDNLLSVVLHEYNQLILIFDLLYFLEKEKLFECLKQFIHFEESRHVYCLLQISSRDHPPIKVELGFESTLLDSQTCRFDVMYRSRRHTFLGIRDFLQYLIMGSLLSLATMSSVILCGKLRPTKWAAFVLMMKEATVPEKKIIQNFCRDYT